MALYSKVHNVDSCPENARRTGWCQVSVGFAGDCSFLMFAVPKKKQALITCAQGATLQWERICVSAGGKDAATKANARRSVDDLSPAGLAGCGPATDRTNKPRDWSAKIVDLQGVLPLALGVEYVEYSNNSPYNGRTVEERYALVQIG